MGENIKLYMAILTDGWIRAEVLSFLYPKLRKTNGVTVTLENPAKTWMHPISANRNAITKRFLATDCDFLLMLDNDVVPLFNPADFIAADKDVIGFPAKVRQSGGELNWVAYVKNPRNEGYSPVDFTLVDDKITLLKVDVVGTGCILIKRRVLEGMKAPFHTPFDEDGIPEMGTDFAFCKRAGEAGFEIFTTPQHVCEHYKTVGLLNVNNYNDIDNIDDRYRKYDMPWGGFSIEPRDWEFIKKVILENNVKTILEFGSGLSSLLMSEFADVVSYEVDGEWADKIKSKASSGLQINMWDGQHIKNSKHYDLVFIDGPRGGENREPSFQAAVKASNRIIVHDAKRSHEIAWQEKYLKDDYNMIARNGFHINSCQYWEVRS